MAVEVWQGWVETCHSNGATPKMISVPVCFLVGGPNEGHPLSFRLYVNLCHPLCALLLSRSDNMFS